MAAIYRGRQINVHQTNCLNFAIISDITYIYILLIKSYLICAAVYRVKGQLYVNFDLLTPGLAHHGITERNIGRMATYTHLESGKHGGIF